MVSVDYPAQGHYLPLVYVSSFFFLISSGILIKILKNGETVHSELRLWTYDLRGSSDALEEGGKEETGIDGARALTEPLTEGERSRSSPSKAGVTTTTSLWRDHGRLRGYS